MVFPANFQEGEGKRFGWRARLEGDSLLPFNTAYWSEDGKEVTENLKGDNSRIIMDRLIPFIKQSVSKAQPFFTTVWFHTPHLPVVADSFHREIYEDLPLDKQIYYGTITALDEQIGRLWNQLVDLDIDQNTIIMFCSDNGPERQTPGSAGVFRERKRSLYEGGVRVPAFAMWKGHFESGRRIAFPAFTSDYLPTIVDLLEIEYKSTRPLDGISILPVLEGHETQREKPMGFIFQSQVTWVNGQYKLKCDDKLENCEFYDLLNDRSESENIVELKSEIAENMKSELVQWLESVNRSKEGGDYPSI
jgi:arylsulfatase A-like enzyme